MVAFRIDRQNRLVYYDNPVGYVREQTAVVDELFRSEELTAHLEKRGLTPRWECGIYDRLVAGAVPGQDAEQIPKGCRVWQLKKNVDARMRFIGYREAVERFGEPDAENYALVFEGDLGTEDLEQIYNLCRDAPPPDYRGHRMGLSDVVELYDESGSAFYYCDRIGFQHISFISQTQVQVQEPTL